jgi:hypothetical protein
MLPVVAWETFSIKFVLKEGSFKMNYRVYTQHNYYGTIICLQNLAVVPHAIHYSYYV